MKESTILSDSIVKMLRCGIVPGTLSEECHNLAELAIAAYSDGKAGAEYIPVEETPGFPAWAAECLDRFLKAAHDQGREDAGI